MFAICSSLSVRAKLDALRTELADLAFELERQGRLDAADVAMILDARVRELTEEMVADDTAKKLIPSQPANTRRLLLS